jgi:hypothetical protein
MFHAATVACDGPSDGTCGRHNAFGGLISLATMVVVSCPFLYSPKYH